MGQNNPDPDLCIFCIQHLERIFTTSWKHAAYDETDQQLLAWGVDVSCSYDHHRRFDPSDSYLHCKSRSKKVSDSKSFQDCWKYLFYFDLVNESLRSISCKKYSDNKL